MTRDLDVGGVLEQVFRTYRQRALILLPAAAIVFLIIGIAEALVITGGFTVARLVVAGAIGFIGIVWYQGLVVETVAESRGRADRLELTDLFNAVRPRLGALLLAGLMLGAAIAVPAVIFALILPAALTLILTVVVAVTATTLFALIAPVIVVEHASAPEAFRRSRELVRGNAWRVLGVIVVVELIQYIVTNLLDRIGSGAFIAFLITVLIANVLTAPLSGLAAALMYFNLLGESQPVADRASSAAFAGEGWESSSSSSAEPHGDFYSDAAHAATQPADSGWDETASTEAYAARGADHTWEQPDDEHAHAEATASQPAQTAIPEHPADWYPDPRGEARLRYWDGSAWTSYTAD